MTQDSPIASPESDPHLSPEGLSDQLKHRSAMGGALMILSFALQLFIGVAGTAVLARLLTPQDFGYLAMVGTVLGFVVTLREFVLAPAVHKEELSHSQASGLFWLNCLASIVVAAGVALMAPVLKWFFHEPKMIPITLVMALGVLFNMLGMVHVGLLRRRMRFGAIALIEIGTSLAGAVVGVVAALLGAEYWALVYQQLAIWICQTLSYWLVCSWRPAARSDSAFHGDEGMRSMIRYGQSATASRVITYLSRNVDSVLVGRFMGAEVLGLYQKAYQWAMTPFWQIFIPMTPVAVSSLSKLQGDPDRYRVFARNTICGLFALTLPGTALLMIEADAVIRILMGNQWLDAIPIFRVLGAGAYFSVFTVAPMWLYLSEGRTGDQLQWSIISAPVTLTGVIVGLKWNAIGVASGFTIAIMLLMLPGTWFCLRKSAMRGVDYLAAIWRPTAASLGAGVVLWIMRSTFEPGWHFITQLIVHSLIYSLLYAIFWLTLPGGWATWKAFLRHFQEIRRGVAAA